jgi:hypothetical protein
MLLASPTASLAQADADLAQKLINPIASLVTIAIQFNADRDIGPADQGEKYTTNRQPVIPFDLGENWNLIMRTIFPLISQKDIAPNSGSQSGLGDINMSLFFSPKQPTSGGLISGVGPVFPLPTAGNSRLGAEKWGTGPAVIVLAQRGAWTVGILADQVWSLAGEDDRSDISSTYVQPFASYTWPSAWTVSV